MSKMMKAILFVGSVALAGFAQAATLVWTGGGADDNFSTPENWDPVQAPAPGDSLTFAGETRTAPYNDLDPEKFIFASITFTNDGSAGKNAAFTLSGNTLKLSGSIKGAQVSGGSLTETFDLEVAFTKATTIGGTADNMSTHHFTFNKKVSAPSNVTLSTTTQHKAKLTFNGPIEGFDRFSRPNGSASIYINGVCSGFATAGFDFNEGSLYIVDASNVGTAKSFRSGQGGYATAGVLYVTPTNDVVLALDLKTCCPAQSNVGLTLCNKTAGKLVTFTGTVSEGGTKVNAGTSLVVSGDGDGRLSGEFKTDRMAFTKNGTGTWTLGAEIPSCALTGLVTVAAGTLCIDCAVPTYKVTVAKNATLAGSGSLGSETIPTTVEFVSGAKLAVNTLLDGSVSSLSVTGAVSLAGSVTVDLKGGAELLPGTRTTLMTYASHSGPGAFVAGTGFPADAILTATDTALYADVPTDTKTWSGETSGEWNKTHANWGGKVYADGSPVVFPDIADAAKRNVAVPETMRPLSVTVASEADHPYSFSGNGGVEGAALVEFTGTATNTWSVGLSDINAVRVSAGKLVLDGKVENSPVTVNAGAELELGGVLTNGTLVIESGAKFNQTASSSICGDSAIIVRNTSSSFYGTNDFTGGLTVGQNLEYGSGNPKSTAYIRAPMSLDAGGDFVVNYNSVLAFYDNAVVSNRTLQIHGYNNNTTIKGSVGHTLEWAGDIRTYEYPQAEIFSGESATFILGKRDGTSVFDVPNGREFVLVCGAVHMYAAYRSTGPVGFRGNLYLYNANNAWSQLNINVGTCFPMADNVLPADKPIKMLQQYSNVQYTSTLDLNGTSQTVSKIITDYNPNVKNWAYFTSEQPATLTVSNATDFTYSDLEVFYVKGLVTLCKKGGAKWTLGVQNTSGGNLEVLEGTLAITDARSFPTGKKSVFRIAEGATLELADGVEGSIAYGIRIVDGEETSLMPGVYGSKTCTVPGVKKVDWIAGAGTLRIRKLLNGGAIIFVR